MLQAIIQKLIGELTEGLKHDLERSADKVLRRVVRTLVLTGMGITFLAAGSIFILISVVSYLSQFMFGGFAWGLVGLIAALAGATSLLLIRR